jgi:cysteinyl-tRNA synthetase
VRIYTCGLTVYDHAHLGHARVFVLFDVLRNFLEELGYRVEYVQNFTDVDDKILNRARREGVAWSDIAERYIQEALRDYEALNLRPPSRFVRATEHIGEMVRIIEGLLRKGYAYVTSTGIYFDVPRFERYGQVSRRRPEELLAGARVEPDPTKRNPADFALWKFHEDEPSWETPWGRGRPGWHIECSAMALKYLGQVDVHGGGEDLIFPHHENEAAQAEAYTGRRFARLWLHVALLQIGGEKMSKSLGNILPIRDALSRWSANAVRLFLLQTHYRKRLELSEEALDRAEALWRLIEEAWWELRQPWGEDRGAMADDAEALHEEFLAALADDFDTPRALQAVQRLARLALQASAVGELGAGAAGRILAPWEREMRVLGLRLREPEPALLEGVRALLAKRSELRAKREYGEADRIRRELLELGVQVKDYDGRSVYIFRSGAPRR